MMKKKFIASVLALFTITSLVGCGSTQTTENADAKEPTRQESNKKCKSIGWLETRIC
ncbi:peptidoglycan hydrolase CwlO-like protein [Clostridium beijerinckii]|uniref:hypothetical protein n=1 Tax=Clostridium beijerinckii TaxID=1520 RepID=UPI0020C6E8A1|nr:hypothetical protein [Clostridium beijerinckii]NRZ88230.1 peptidoglycan hydrolase CwlO-like protein [Clostridium beijerinckii]